MRAPPPSRLFFALALVAFTCSFPYLAWVNNPNENVRVYMTMALVEQHTLRIDRIVARRGWINDMAKAPDEETGEYHLYSVKAPATSFAGVPFYWAMTKIAPLFGHTVPSVIAPVEERTAWLRATTLVLRLFSVQLPCFAFLVWFERWLRGTSRDPVLRLTAVAAAGLGSNYLAYALMFASHATCACAAFASFALTYRERERCDDARRRRRGVAFWAGLFAGLATLLEYHALPLSAVLAVYALCTFWRPAALASLALGGAIDVAAMMLFQWRAFGSPWTPGHTLSENPFFARDLNRGFFGIERPSWAVLRDISLSHEYGFFGLSPFMWLGLLAIPFVLLARGGGARARKERRIATAVWAGAMAVLWVAVSAANNWRGGWTVGPRYLAAAPPFFAFGALCGLEQLAGDAPLRRAVARGVAGGLALVGVVSVGLVGLHCNTLPDATPHDGVTRPLAQITLPLARAGFVPHHAAELVGWTSPVAWYAVAGCLLAAGLVPALWPSRDAWRAQGARYALVAASFALGMLPAFGRPDPDEGGDGGLQARRDFVRGWEPAGRDRIHALRASAERLGPEAPCLWSELAALERTVGADADADADARRAGAAGGACR